MPPKLAYHVLLQAIRTSFRDSVRTMIITLGENATVADILDKLDDFYGNASTSETLMQNFYSDCQKDDDTIVEYGSRIEQTFTRALRSSSMEQSLRDVILRTTFWTGLSNQSLKNSTRHLFYSVKDFELLLREMRKVEQEQVSATVSRPAGKQQVAQQHSGQTSDVPDTAQLSKQLNEMMEKMNVMEKKKDSQQQALAAKQFSFQDDSQQQCGDRYTKGRGYSNNRGCNRGSYRSYGRGRGFGRGFQNSGNNDKDQNSNRGDPRGRNRGGASGRGTKRGGYSRGDLN